MLIGYLRPGMADDPQALASRRDALLAAGVTAARLYEDHAAVKCNEWPGLKACLRELRPGDTLMVWTLGCLGRDLRHLVQFVDGLTGRGVGLRVLAGVGLAIDTTAPGGRSMAHVFAALAGFQRDLVAERAMRGLVAARANGRLGGRLYKMTPAKLRMAQEGLRRRGTGVGKLCTELGITRQTLYRHVDPEGRLRPDGEKLLRRRPNELPEGLSEGQRHA